MNMENTAMNPWINITEEATHNGDGLETWVTNMGMELNDTIQHMDS